MAFWRAAGGTLFDWQEFAIEQMLGVGDDDQWASVTDGLNVARQNGKGVILQAIEAFFAFELGYSVVMHTAHEFATSQEHQLRLEAMIQNASHLHARVRDRGGYMHANGQESIRLKSGCRILFKARTKGGGRGYSGDLLVWDEAMVIADAVVSAQMPMLRASQSPHGRKVIYAGSAVDQLIHDHGLNFARLRERGIASAPKMSWHEWSAPFDHPDEVTLEVLRDRSAWRAANPSMDAGLVSEETMADECADMPARAFAVELLGVGDWPATSIETPSVVDMARWDSLEDPDSVAVDSTVLAFDVTPDRRSAAIVEAGRRSDGLTHGEVLEHRAGTGWVAERLIQLRDERRPARIVCDGRSPAAALLQRLEELGVEVEVTSAAEHAQACGLLYDLIEQDQFRHLGTPELRQAIHGAATRPLGEAWAWSRRLSHVDISPLVAVTLAVWGSGVAAPAKGFIGWSAAA